MKQSTRDLLACPKCGSQLKDSSSGVFTCQEHGEFKTIDGVLCFTPMSHFDEHWELNNLVEIPATKIDVGKNYLEPLLETKANSDELSLLDVGCGDGVHVGILNDAIKNLKPIGIDISLPALQIAMERDRSNNWDFIKADAGSLPFRSECFDAAISYGVLAYTDNPVHSFSELCRVTKEGGMVGVWIYPRLGGLKGLVFNMVRSIAGALGTGGATFIANLMVPFIGFLPTASKISLSNASWKECREIIMVNIFPDQLIFPTKSEIEGWFKLNNVKVVKSDDSAPITLWGIKGNESG